MKKSLLAIAAIGAFASAAQAQSSVTVYGILDVGYVGSSTRTGGSGNIPTPANQTSAAATPIPVAKTQANGFTGAGAENTSRLGFKGTEDLGGGTSAFFTVELAITPQSEQAISTAATQNRQSFVGLKKNGIAAASIGTQYTPVHRAVASTDPGGSNNIVGSIIYAAPGSALAAGNGGAGAYTVRTNNMLYVESDKFAGFQGNAFYTQNNSNTNQVTLSGTQEGYTGGTNNQNGWGLGVNYTWQKLYLTAAYQALNSKNPITVNNVNTNNDYVATGYPAAFVSASGGTNIKDNQQYYAATYDFGILKAYAGYINRKATFQYDTGAYAKRSGQQIGVRSYITPTIEAWANIGNGRLSSFGNASPTANFNAWQLGSNYYLSKRTNLYAIYGQQVTSTASYGANATTNGQTGTINGAKSEYALGVRHTF